MSDHLPGQVAVKSMLYPPLKMCRVELLIAYPSTCCLVGKLEGTREGNSIPLAASSLSMSATTLTIATLGVNLTYKATKNIAIIAFIS